MSNNKMRLWVRAGRRQGNEDTHTGEDMSDGRRLWPFDYFGEVRHERW